MKNIQMIRDRQALMKKYFKDTLNGKNKNHDEFLRNCFKASMSPNIEGLEVLYKDFNGAYYGYYVVIYKDNFYVLSSSGNDNFEYEGELTEFVKIKAEDENQTMEEFILKNFPYEVCYVANSFREFLLTRDEGGVALKDSGKTFELTFEGTYGSPTWEIYDQSCPEKCAFFSNKDKNLAIDKLISLIGEAVIENNEKNIYLF